MNHIYGGGTHFRDVRNLVLRVTSKKKIEANRLNAKKSTGPSTLRGKSLARFNALKQGLFALQRLLPGEDRLEYECLSAQIFDELAPQTAIETMLVDQIIGDIWRLKRLDLAELAFFYEMHRLTYTRTLAAMSDEEFALAERVIEDEEQVRDAQAIREQSKRLRRAGEKPQTVFVVPRAVALSQTEEEYAKRTSRPNDEAELSFVKQKLEAIDNVGATLLNGMGANENPFFVLDRTRNSTLRELLRKYAHLADIQDRRRSIVSNS